MYFIKIYLFIIFFFLSNTSSYSQESARDSLIQIISNPSVSEDIKKEVGRAYAELKKKELKRRAFEKYKKVDIENLKDEELIFYTTNDSIAERDKIQILNKLAEIGNEKTLIFLINNISEFYFPSDVSYGNQEVYSEYYCYLSLNQMKNKWGLIPLLVNSLSTKRNNLNLILIGRLLVNICDKNEILINNIIVHFRDLFYSNEMITSQLDIIKREIDTQF